MATDLTPGSNPTAYFNIVGTSNGTTEDVEQKNSDMTNEMADKHMIVSDLYAIFNRLQDPRAQVIAIDIRSPNDFNESNILESVNIPIKSNKNEIQSALMSYLETRWRWIKTFVFITDIETGNIKKCENEKKLSFIIKIIDIANVYLLSQMNEAALNSQLYGGKSNGQIELPLYYVLDADYNTFYKKFSFLCKDKKNNKNGKKDKNTSNDNKNEYMMEADRNHYPNSIIKDRLYLGDGFHATMIHVMKDLGITHIVNVTESVPCLFEKKEEIISDVSPKDKEEKKDENDSGSDNQLDRDIIYCYIPINDDATAQIGWYFDYAYEFIDNALNSNENNKVLVHCVAGVSRSATITLSYLMKLNDWTLKDAFSYVIEKRPMIKPNFGFMDYLMALEKQLFSKKSKNNNTSNNKNNNSNNNNNDNNGNKNNDNDSDGDSDDDENELDLDLGECTSMELYNNIVDNIDNNNTIMFIIDIRDSKKFENKNIKESINVPIKTQFNQNSSNNNQEHKNNNDNDASGIFAKLAKDKIRNAMLELNFYDSNENRKSVSPTKNDSKNKVKSLLDNDGSGNDENNNNSIAKPKIIFITEGENVRLMQAMSNGEEWFNHICKIMEYIALKSLLPKNIPLFCLSKVNVENFYQKYPFLCNLNQSSSDNNNNDNKSIFGFDKVFASSYPTMILEDKLYLGSYHHATSFDILTNLNITHIVNCTREISNKYENNGLTSFGKELLDVSMDDILNEIIFDEENNSIMVQANNNGKNNNNDKKDENKENNETRNEKDRKIIYHKIDITDDSQSKLTINKLNNAIKFIENGLKDDSNKILIHCNRGKSRSVGVTMGYLMKQCNMSLDDAYTFVQKKRKQADPNEYIWETLQEFEDEIKKS